MHKKTDDEQMTHDRTTATLSTAMSFTVRTLDDGGKKRRSWKPLLLGALKVSGPLLAGAREWKRKREERHRHEERVNVLKRILVILVTVFCGLLLFAGSVKALVSLRVLNFGSLVSVAGSDLPTDRYGHTNILLLGQGDADHDGVDLTDTIMIASIDGGATKSVVLLSLPRDLYFLETENMGEGRINSLYRDYKIVLRRQGMDDAQASQTAMRELADEIGKALKMDIHHIVKVDFIGFTQAVDAIGGIDIVVPETLVDTQYPGPNYTVETFSIEAGPQRIDGETALKYARSRHSSSDFARSARQQQILQAIADKIRSEGLLTKPGQITELLGIMKEHVETDLQVRDMVSLAGIGKDMDREGVITMQLNTQNGLYGELSQPGGFLYNPPRNQFGGASVLLPVSIPESPVTWTRVQTLTHLLLHMRGIYVQNTPITILNAGAPPGSARQLGSELIRYGLNVTTMENADGDDQVTSSLAGSQGDAAALLLSNLLAMEFKSIATMESSASSARPDVPHPITITLGEDYEYTPLQDAIVATFPAQ